MTHASHKSMKYCIDWGVLSPSQKDIVLTSIFNDGAAYGRAKALEEVKKVIDDLMHQTPSNGVLRFPIMRNLTIEWQSNNTPVEGPSWDVVELTRDHWAVIKYQLTGGI